MNSLIKNFKKLLLHATTGDVVLVVASIFVVSVLEGLGIGLIIPIISFAADPESASKFPFIARVYEVGGFSEPAYFILALIAGLTVFFAFKNLIFVLSTYLQTWFALRSGADLSAEMLRLYMRSPYLSHLRRDSAKSLIVIHEFVSVIFNNYLLSCLTLFTEIIVITAVLAVLMFVSPYITLSAVAVMGIGSGLFYLTFRNRFRELGEAAAGLAKESVASIRNSLSSVKEARVLGRDPFFYQEFSRIRKNHARVLTIASTLGVLPRGVTETLAMLAVLAVVGMMLLVDQPTAEIPALLGMFAVAALRIVPSANRILFLLNKLRHSEPYLEQVMEEYEELVSEEVREPDPLTTKELNFEKSLNFENVKFSYPDQGHAALYGITINIQQGESIGLVGPSGAGKTTLGDMILGLLPPSSGIMCIDGIDVYKNLSAWHGRVGYVPQSIHILNTTLRNNIAFGIPSDEIDDRAVTRALHMAHLERVVSDLPRGLDTVLGEQGMRLSGGQRQRVGIARALYHDPELLVLDEATSALDSGTEQEIIRAMDELARAKTVIFIAHRLSTVKNCDRLYFMKDGFVVASGTFDELLRDNVEFRAMVEDASLESVETPGEGPRADPPAHTVRA